jgi:hypothetical protein
MTDKEFWYGWKYAKFVKATHDDLEDFNLDKNLPSIPEDEIKSMQFYGITDPNPLYFWAGYVAYCATR